MTIAIWIVGLTVLLLSSIAFGLFWRAQENDQLIAWGNGFLMTVCLILGIALGIVWIGMFLSRFKP